MAASTTYPLQFVLPERLRVPAQAVLILVVAVILSLPLFVTKPGPLGSDESLYVAEGLNLSDGQGFTYTSGEAVNHRGPVFPALLAGDFALTGFSLDHARGLVQLFALGNAVLLFALGWRLFGRESGLAAAALALASSLLVIIANSILLDGVETFFLLAMLLALYEALRHGKPAWAAAAGVAFGLAVLTKESALLWAPMPYIACLLLGRAVARPKALLVAYAAGAIAVAGWWWPYVFVVTGRVYLLGTPLHAALWLVLGAFVLVLADYVADSIVSRTRSIDLNPPHRWAAAGLVALVWGAIFLVGLERHATWPFSHDYLHTVPDYTRSVLWTWLRPLPLIAIAWGYVSYRAVKGSLGDRLLVLALVLFLPFALFVANRGLSVRDILPLVYLSYLALGRAAIDAARWIAEAAGQYATPAAGGALAALLLAGGFAWFAIAEHSRVDAYTARFDAMAVRQDNWDNPLVQRTAAWVEEHVPAGTPIMSSRLYYSSLYTLTDARYPWWQLPTVRVDVVGDPPALERASTLFRWEDHDMPSGDGAPWLYLRRYPVKHYYVALSERDLLATIEEQRIGYVIITGDDAGFSSLRLLSYFESNPGFREVAALIEDSRNQAYVFQVLPERLHSTAAPAAVSESTASALRKQLGRPRAEALLDGLSAGGYVITGSPAAAGALDEGP